MSNSRLNLDLVVQVLSKTLPDQPPALIGKVPDSSLLLADYRRYKGSQIKEHENQFHTLELIGLDSCSNQKRCMGDFKTEKSLTCNEVYFCPSQANYSLIWDKTVDFTLLALDPILFEEIAEDIFGSSQFELVPKLLAADTYPVKDIVNMIKQEMALKYPNGSLFLENLRNNLVIALLNNFAIKKSSTPKNGNLSNNKIKLIQDYIQEHLSENLLLEDLAKLVYISPFHLSRAFKQATGLTITSYIIQERIKLAQKLLIDSPLNITQIAYLCGFHDASHFNRHFKLLMQTTPTAFRKNCTNLT